MISKNCYKFQKTITKRLVFKNIVNFKEDNKEIVANNMVVKWRVSSKNDYIYLKTFRNGAI